MTTEVISYNSINDTDIESELIEDKEDFFVEVAKIFTKTHKYANTHKHM